jgi:hypothetical protein
VSDLEWIVVQSLFQLSLPPLVGLDRQEQIGIVRRDDLGQSVGCPILLQHVDDQQAEGAWSGEISRRAHLDRPNARVGQDDRQLRAKAHEQGQGQRQSER